MCAHLTPSRVLASPAASHLLARRRAAGVLSWLFLLCWWGRGRASTSLSSNLGTGLLAFYVSSCSSVSSSRPQRQATPSAVPVCFQYVSLQGW